MFSQQAAGYKLVFYSKESRGNNPNHNPRLHLKRRAVSVETRDACVLVNLGSKHEQFKTEPGKSPPFPSKEKSISFDLNYPLSGTNQESITFEEESKFDGIERGEYLYDIPFNEQNRDTSSLQDDNSTKFTSTNNGGVTIEVTNFERNLYLDPSNRYDNDGDIEIATNKSPTLLVLSSFEADQVLVALARAAQTLNSTVVICKSYEEIRQGMSNFRPDFFVVAVRHANSNLEYYEHLCKFVKYLSGDVIPVAIVEERVFNKEPPTIARLLRGGFHRCICASTNFIRLSNELVTLYHRDLYLATKTFVFKNLFYDSSNNSKDGITVLNDSYRVEYCNRSFRDHLKYDSFELIVGKEFRRSFMFNEADWKDLEEALSDGREWRGHVDLRTKTEKKISLFCVATRLSHNASEFSHVLLNFRSFAEPESEIKKVAVSTEVADKKRKRINAVLKLLVEAKTHVEDTAHVKGLLTEAMNSLSHIDPEEADRGTGLEDIEEPVVSDLMVGLTKRTTSGLPLADQKTMVLSKVALKESQIDDDDDDSAKDFLQWNFNIFSLEDKSKETILVNLGMKIYKSFKLPDYLKCSETVLLNWLTVIQKGYRLDVKYHNATHAADVLQATAAYLTKDRIKNLFSHIDDVSCLIAAAAHDLEHPGRTSAFLCNSQNKLAILYNDLSVLENHHASTAFHLTLSDDRTNIFKNLDNEVYRNIRYNVIDLILATEMARHFQIFAKYLNIFDKMSLKEEDGGHIDILYHPDNVLLIRRMVIKCSDVSNCARPFHVALEWCLRITEEYFLQTDEEKARRLPVVMPMFDRETCSVPKSQIGFIEYIVNEMFEAWNAFIDMPELLQNVRKNYKEWKRLLDEGYVTVSDIQKVSDNLKKNATH